MPILYGGELGLICMGWNVPSVIEGNCKFSFVGLCVNLHHVGLFESSWMCLSCWLGIASSLALNLEYLSYLIGSYG